MLSFLLAFSVKAQETALDTTLFTITHDVYVFNLKDGNKAVSINGYFLPQKVHVYQPLEKMAK